MLKVDFSDEFIDLIAEKVVQQLLPMILTELKQNEFPHLLSRKEFMELVGIGETKCNELFHRKDFPVNRELGNPKVPTKTFFEWLNATNQNANEVNMNCPFKNTKKEVD